MAPTPDRKYFEDLPVGLGFGGDTYRVEQDEMVGFASKWDPREIHLDDAAAQQMGFDGLIASGAMTLSIFTLLARRGRERDGDHAVLAVVEATNRLPAPIYAGDELTYWGEIVDARPSESRPKVGVVVTRGVLANQRDDVVFESVSTALFHRRPGDPPDDLPSRWRPARGRG